MKKNIAQVFILFASAVFLGTAAPAATAHAQIPQNYYYKLLTDADQRQLYTAYQHLLQGPGLIVRGKEEARLEHFSEAELKAFEAEGTVQSFRLEHTNLTQEDLPDLVTTVLEALEYDNPMDVRGQALSMVADATVVDGTLYVAYINPPDLDYAGMQRKADAGKNEILRAIQSDPRYRNEAAVEELLVHDYLCDRMTYDGAAATGEGDRLYVGHTVYAALVEHHAVCDAISMSCAAILQDLGVDCYVLGGDAHAWNMVSLGGEFYELDCTWDMASLSDTGQTSHQYFNRTTDYMTGTEHTRDGLALRLPQATGTRCTYEQIMTDMGTPLGEYTLNGIRYVLDDNGMASVVGLEDSVKKIQIPAYITVNDHEYSVSFIEEQAFQNSSLKKVVIPETVALIGPEAFAGCKKLKTVVIKDAAYLQYVEQNAFRKSAKKITFKLHGSRAACENLQQLLQNAGVRKGIFVTK